MSIRAITWAFDQVCQSPTAKLILIKLADNANDEGVCWPSVDYMMEHCELSRRSVQRNINKLVKLGHIEIAPRFRNNLQQSNSYLLKIPNKMRGVTVTRRGVNKDQTGASQRRPESSSEPQNKAPAAKPVDNSTLDSNLRRKGESAVDMVDRWKREFEKPLAGKLKDVVKH